MSAFNSLSLGPGRPHELERLMRGQDPSRDISRLTDLAELLQCPPGRALLDGTLLPAEDLGILRRALQSGDQTITILGGDPSTGTLREVLKHPCASWLPYPPDSEEISQLIAAPLLREKESVSAPKAPEAATNPEPQSERKRSNLERRLPAEELEASSSPPIDPDLAEIEAILGQPVSALQTADLVFEAVSAPDPASAPPEEERPPAAEAEEELLAPEVMTPEPAAPLPPPEPTPQHEAAHDEPDWFKDQVADLADIVQTIYTSTSTMTEGEAAAPPGLLADSMRLVQFTRTLGFLAAPPARGDTEFDLSDLAEELLRSAGAASDAPRFLLKIAAPMPVRGNKELIVQALDAILVLARLCAGPEGEVRMSGGKSEEGGALLKLGFARGPLGAMTPAEIVVPYALRSTLPDMGKNALRAASRIIEGQGGSLTLSDPGDGLLQFSLSLPTL